MVQSGTRKDEVQVVICSMLVEVAMDFEVVVGSTNKYTDFNRGFLYIDDLYLLYK